MFSFFSDDLTLRKSKRPMHGRMSCFGSEVRINGDRINGYFTYPKCILTPQNWRHFEDPNPASYRLMHPSIGGSSDP